MQVLRLTSDSLFALRTKARKTARRNGREVCGVLIREESGELSVRFLRNLSKQPAKWLIKRSWLSEIREELKETGRRLVGTFHSHVGGYAYPGQADLDDCSSNFLMLIYDTIEDKFGMWRPRVVEGKGYLKALALARQDIGLPISEVVDQAKYLQGKFRKQEKRNEAN